ncbi:MAG: hypothetical protein SFX73_15650 [Kofleriaceae bacterium]|nr:hypothetical protein [Kofleriaceae bacterium]
MRTPAVLALVAASLVVEPTVSDACSKRHQPIYELFDDAVTVAEVQVTKVPTATKFQVGAGPVALRAKRIIKGPKATSLTTHETNTSCHIGFRAGKNALVFLDKKGHTVGGYEGYFEDVARWRSALDAWAAATDDAARAAVLVAEIEKGDEAVAYDAAYHLANHPELIAQLDAKTRDQLLAMKPKRETFTMLPVLAVRLRGKDLTDKRAKAVLAVTEFETVTDPNVLADAIRDGKGESDPKRIAAFERCERIHGRKLYPFTAYINGVAAHFWPKLAEVCRSGTPHHY